MFGNHPRNLLYTIMLNLKMSKTFEFFNCNLRASLKISLKFQTIIVKSYLQFFFDLFRVCQLQFLNHVSINLNQISYKKKKHEFFFFTENRYQ